MLYDHAHIFVQGGRGGDGCMSFRREAHVPKGGPDGGDGGRGGRVVLVCDESRRDLQAFQRRSHFKADRGQHGEGALKKGAEGVDLVVQVAPGTQVQLVDGTMVDLVLPGQKIIVAEGGSGGKGNARFASSTRQSPRFRERGIDGDEGWIKLRLKLMADVGLIGLPNAGKSSLISRLTKAKPKVANYPFTTLQPVLGTIQGATRQLVVADIPGLIEGASEGKGLGHEFLAHVERCRTLLHVLELKPEDQGDPKQNFKLIETELERYNEQLSSLPRILVLSKTDLVAQDEAEAAEKWWDLHLNGSDEDRKREEWEDAPPPKIPVILTSSASGEGVDELRRLLLQTVPEADHTQLVGIDENEEPLVQHKVYRPTSSRSWSVDNVDGVFVVSGPGIERLLARHDLDNDESLEYIESRLHKLGILEALGDSGFKPGDDVEIAGVAFDLDPAW